MKFSNLILKLFIDTDLQKDILFLRSIDFFEELNTLQLKKIRARMYKKTYLPKEVLYKKGQEAKFFCVVRSGKIELDDGQDKRIIRKRDFFGQKYVFNNNELYTNTATALENSEVFLLYKDDIEALMEKDKNIGFRMFKKLLKMLYKRAQNER
ncbi:MAG: cyclic nucleotide-binding domain-containing protein [Endomicrobiaceae bacterium]|nr:cyclic nucleotide-binding domain-containing protein [Endomicrobiaceae bacterium]